VSNTLKSPGYPCPKCKEPFPAEYAQIGQPARWTCHGCSASGPLTGDVARSSTPTPPKKTAVPPPWARNLTKGRP
jgi:hypothetical protein